ncbi:MAG TPA: ribonuclease R [Vicinamibacterales bacterium]|nr:ribonuclease R [Vicinamibacterales bacterium]
MLSNEQILKLIREKVDHPATVQELLQKLRIPKGERPAFKRRLNALVASGDLVETSRAKRFGLPERMNLVVGRVSTSPRGFAFVTPDRAGDEFRGDIYIAGANLNEAVHGDRVLARVEHVRDRRAEGRIVRIVERGTEQIVGRYDEDDAGTGYVAPFDRRLLMDVQIPRGEEKGAQAGQMVTVAITRWPTDRRGAQGRVIDVLGNIEDPGVDTTIIIRKYGIRDAHDPAAVEEARRLGGSVKEADLATRTDFRRVPTVTIDGADARDFDDAITIERLPNGNYWLGVHIADVAHYVTEGSALDEDAYERATSVYFPERAVHMFPSELSTGLCSLNPNVDRLTQSVQMEINRRGHVVNYEFHDGVIHSDAQMTYTKVHAILKQKDTPDGRQLREEYRELVPMFEMMEELFDVLYAARRRRGSIDFDLRESKLMLDDEGMVEAIIATERNVAHRLIEEFMLLANETVAGHLDSNNVPSLYRIHEEPDPAKVEAFEEFISSFGYSLTAPSNNLQPKHFQKLIDKMRGKPEERPIAFLILRTMQKARYDPANLGHFGLAADTYTHFTSPIRRYPDLVVHRSLREARRPMAEERREELSDDLPEIARHTSERERRASDAERELVQWKKVRFMTDKVGDEFDGYITGVSAFGLYVELIEHFVDGLVHVSTMADDYYRFIERQHVLRGENAGRVFRLGDRVRVQVIRVDMERRQVDLGIADILNAIRDSEQNRGPRRSKAKPKDAARAHGVPARPGKGQGKGKPRAKGGRPGKRERAFKKAVGKGRR